MFVIFQNIIINNVLLFTVSDRIAIIGVIVTFSGIIISVLTILFLVGKNFGVLITSNDNIKNDIRELKNDVRELKIDVKEIPVIKDRVNVLWETVFTVSKSPVILLEYQDSINSKTIKLNIIITELEKLTWFDDLDIESIDEIKSLLKTCKKLHTILIRYYTSLNNPTIKEYCKTEIKSLKIAIDDYKETCDDLDAVFNVFPNDAEFIETTIKLSSI